MASIMKILRSSRYWVELSYKTDLDFRPLEALWIFIIEAIFSILLFYTNSSSQNPISWSVFSKNEVERSVKLKLRVTNQILIENIFTSVINMLEMMIISISKSMARLFMKLSTLRVKNTPTCGLLLGMMVVETIV